MVAASSAIVRKHESRPERDAAPEGPLKTSRINNASARRLLAFAAARPGLGRTLMIWKFALSGVSAVVLAAALTPACAADIPKLVGTWKPAGDDHAGVRLGTATQHSPRQETPTFDNRGTAGPL
jgi:hypothetical protein